MNKVILMGRLTREPEGRAAGDLAITHYSLAVDRRFKREGEPTADFFDCVTFGKAAEFARKYLHKGTKIAVMGRIQTRSYETDGVTKRVTEIIVDEQEFAESKAASAEPVPPKAPELDTFEDIPADIDEELPFA